jgi:hypothetical protein
MIQVSFELEICKYYFVQKERKYTKARFLKLRGEINDELRNV